MINATPPHTDAQGHKIFTVGTLSYSKQGLWLLFFWLMWNDFTIMMIERVTTLNNILLQKHGSSYTLMAIFASITGIMGMWINPCFSTWSDRLRTRFGRRRPILFISVPIFAVSLMAIPCMPDFYNYVVTLPGAASVIGHVLGAVNWSLSLVQQLPTNGEALFMGAAIVVSGLCNAVVLSIFSYYYWDVVPSSVLGRFSATGGIVTAFAMLIWNFFIVGKADNHPKEVYIGVSLFCTLIYLLSVWQVKEGEYPPPEPREKTGALEPVREYFKDCYSKSFFLWIFFGSLIYQIGNKGNDYVNFYQLNDLNLHLEGVGWAEGWAQTATLAFTLSLGFAAGSFIDRFKPVRMIPIFFFIRTIISLAAFYFVQDKLSAAVFGGMISIIVFLTNVALGAATVQLFPREKLGQFCSAQAFFYQTIGIIITPLIIAPFFDYIHYNRFGYIWLTTFYFLTALIYTKVYFNWKRHHAEMSVED